ncbi:MAG: hypothetical protein RIR26_193 [Pseudomonadota bacterium]|jgi:ATP phosphoribosyltransferase
MQDSSRSHVSKTLPRWGEGLARLRAWENDFRMLAAKAGFSELNLPLSLPTSEFISGLTGENTLPAAPRFLDTTATEWSLRSDLTLFSAQFVCRHAADLQFPFKLFYSGKVFSPQGILGAEGFRLGHANEFESFEFGAEIIGQKELDAELELLDFALAALRSFGYSGVRVVVGDARILKSIEEDLSRRMAEPVRRSALLQEFKTAVHNKDFGRLSAIFARMEISFDRLIETCPAYGQLFTLIEHLEKRYQGVSFQSDPLLTRQRQFYTGLIFDFWAEDADGRLHNVGGGGRYDHLLSHFGRPHAAAGFMIRDPQTSGVEPQPTAFVTRPMSDSPNKARRPVRIALPKGRLLKWGTEAFSHVGIKTIETLETTRKLVLPSECGRYEFLLVKNSDALSYVERGIAEIAIVGSDVLDEQPHSLLRPLTFAFGSCRICLAGRPELQSTFHDSRKKRVATKYPTQAMKMLRERGLNTELVPLQGSVELASVISFCDAIVDLVETGSTLRENGLVIYEELARTRVQLVMSRGFFVEAEAMLREWSQIWSDKEFILEPHFALDAVGEKQP